MIEARDQKSEAAARRSEILLMISCGILGTTTVLVLTGAICIASDVPGRTRGAGHRLDGRINESQDRHSEWRTYERRQQLSRLMILISKSVRVYLWHCECCELLWAL